MNRLNKVLLGTVALLPLFVSCSHSDKDEPEEWLLPDDSNSTLYVEFDVSFKGIAGDNGAVETDSLTEFNLYGFNTSLGYSVFGNTKTTKPQSVKVTQNKDDHTMWDYLDSKTGKMLKWQQLEKYPISFYGIGGDGVDMASFYLENDLPVLKVTLPVNKGDGAVHSCDTHDLMFATALDLNPAKYENDSTNVILDFYHVMPKVSLRATLDQASDLEVTIQSATLLGFAVKADYDFSYSVPSWKSDGLKDNTSIVMTQKDPVILGTESVRLQDDGTFILPQTVKPWSSAANKDGAGIMLMSRIRSKVDGSYLAGSADSYGPVYVAIDNTSFLSGTAYTLDITFSTLYNENGSLGYRTSYKPVVSPWSYKDENLICE